MGVTRNSTQRLRILNDVERLLLIWINEKQLQHATINENTICEKAKAIFADLVKKTPGSSTAEKTVFKASRGWFEKFKRRTGIHSVVRHGEAASSDTKAAEIFIDDFKKLVDTKGYLPQQVFNCDETGLFWKKLPKRTYITVDENALSGHNPMKDRLTLLFCANASGDLKLKPLVVYHAETPRAFKKYKIQKSKLNVMWRSNNKAWVTRDIFTDWINKVFGPSMKKYLLEMNLPLQALLVMDNAPAHPPGLQNELLEEFNFIKILFLPSNTTPLLQPMDQQVISNFKKLYTKILFERCFEVTEETKVTLKEFWKYHFHIFACLEIIDKAWEGVNKRTLISAWKKLWPESVVECHSEKVDTLDVEPLVNEIVSLANTIGLEVNSNDIDELVEEHNQDLTTEELTELLRLSQQEDEKESVSDKKTLKEPSSDAIKEMLKAWENVASFVEKHHPNEVVAVRAANLFYDNAVLHFEQILKRRRNQTATKQD
ncbi:tigger transposable element-derived protein 1-like [Onthophagus taurus]|uniref:tigger transposable element-derived protein 1-like n=1 Tax=Onthophagus taurus TaxID=166361 RepID=UPI0039BE5274